MWIHRPNPLSPVGGTETPADVVHGRRRWLRAATIAAGLGACGGAGYWGWKKFRGSDEEVIDRGRVEGRLDANFPAPRDERFAYGRPETAEAEAARYTNFYEFSEQKWNWRYVDGFRVDPWTISIGGLCRRPLKLDIDELHRRFASDLTERQYRHRCVETWAMAVPWSGAPLAKLLAAVDPLASATHVRFVSFNRPNEAAGFARSPHYPWPYSEGLTIAEAAHDLTLLATGMYGGPLLKQHGAPIRLVVPWKYGFKSIKSIERIELIDFQPATFWNTAEPTRYAFESNVDPAETIPWPQDRERMLGTNETYPTQKYNGYGEYVAGIYA